jgi:hypothetical protein
MRTVLETQYNNYTMHQLKHALIIIIIIIVYSSKTLLCCSNLPWAHQRILSKFIDNLGMCPKTGSSALAWISMAALIFCRMLAASDITVTPSVTYMD